MKEHKTAEQLAGEIALYLGQRPALKLVQIEQLAGIPRNTLGGVNTGTRTIPTKHAVKIAAVLRRYGFEMDPAEPPPALSMVPVYTDKKVLQWLKSRPALSVRELENEIRLPAGTLNQCFRRDAIPARHLVFILQVLYRYGFRV